MTISDESKQKIQSLFTTPPALLTSMEKQDLYVVQKFSVKLRCPGCYEFITYLDTLPDGADWETIVGYEHADLKCPLCGQALEYVIPFTGGEFFIRKPHEHTRSP